MEQQDSNPESILRQVKISPAPDLLLELNQLMLSEAKDISLIADLVSKDAGISALVIKTVNSPLYPVRSQVSSIKQAIGLLGIGFITNIITGLLLKQDLAGGVNLPRYWEAPSNIALIMSRLSKQLLDCSTDDAYLIGLFHNTGHALIQQKDADYTDFYMEHINHTDLSIAELENAQYGFDHAVLGFYLAKSWGVAEHISQVILNHHRVEEMLETGNRSVEENCMKGLLAILKLAEHLEWEQVTGERYHEWTRVGQTVLDYLLLSDDDYEDIRQEIFEYLQTDLH